MHIALHYKGESALPFAIFLAKCKRMFTLHDQIGEPYTESAKLCFLFDKVQNAELKHPLEGVRTVVSMNPDAFTFTSAANHLSSLVKPRSKRELAAVTTNTSKRKLAAVTTIDNSGGDKSEIIKNGKIYTYYYPNGKENQKLVIVERKKLGRFGKLGGQRKGRKTGKKL